VRAIVGEERQKKTLPGKGIPQPFARIAEPGKGDECDKMR